jgi:hypothetical protein
MPRRLIPHSEVFEKLTVAQLVKNYLPFMESKSSLPWLQQPATEPQPEPDESSPHTSRIFWSHFNIILPSVPGSSKWHLPLSFSGWSPVCICRPSHVCYLLRSYHTVFFRLSSFHFLCLRSRYFPQHVVLRYPKSLFVPSRDRPEPIPWTCFL